MMVPTQQINQFINSYYRYLAVATVVVVAVVFWQFLLKPQYTTIQTSGVLEYRHITEMVSEREVYLQQLQHMKQEYDQLDRRSLRYIDVALPANYNQADAFAEIDQLFQNTSLAVQSINVAALADVVAAGDSTTPTVPSNKNYTPILITVNVTARQPRAEANSGPAFNYTELKKVLHHIEQHQHVLNLEQLVYSPNRDSFTLILRTYQRVMPDTTL